MKLKTASGSITLAPEDGSGDVSVTIPRAGVIPTKSTIDALGIAATSVTGAQASAITANTAKTGITSSQASAITANTAKVTNSTSASDLTSGTLADARFPATLPAISGANLTNLPSGGGGGGWTAISSQTITGTPTSITFGSLDLSAYRVVRLEIYTVKRSNNLYTYLETSNDGFTTTDSWLLNALTYLDNTTTDYFRSSNDSLLHFTPHNKWNLITHGVTGYIDFIVNNEKVIVNGFAVAFGDSDATVQWSGIIDDTTFTDLKIRAYSGTFSSGTFRLVGMA